MGNLTQDVGALGQYAGFYKGIQAAGGAISWKINGSKVSGLWQIGINLVLFFVCLGPVLRIASTLDSRRVETRGSIAFSGAEVGNDSSMATSGSIAPKDVTSQGNIESI